MIVPKVHRGSFVDMSREEVEQFASVLKGALLKLEVCLHNPPYNFNLHTAPCGQEHTDGFHWHLDIVPRLTTSAGFELGTGIYINVTRPEDAAAFLREADASIRGMPRLEFAAP
jgi:UDPglucose--hexose-1-phosphate uridylyltransferase